jgi:hypothetical protein
LVSLPIKLTESSATIRFKFGRRDCDLDRRWPLFGGIKFRNKRQRFLMSTVALIADRRHRCRRR